MSQPDTRPCPKCDGGKVTGDIVCSNCLGKGYFPVDGDEPDAAVELQRLLDNEIDHLDLVLDPAYNGADKVAEDVRDINVSDRGQIFENAIHRLPHLQTWQERREVITAAHEAEVQAAVRAAFNEAADMVLRATEIPRDAREPTRDFLVVWGEQMAERIRKVALDQPTGGEK